MILALLPSSDHPVTLGDVIKVIFQLRACVFFLSLRFVAHLQHNYHQSVHYACIRTLLSLNERARTSLFEYGRTHALIVFRVCVRGSFVSGAPVMIPNTTSIYLNRCVDTSRLSEAHFSCPALLGLCRVVSFRFAHRFLSSALLLALCVASTTGVAASD